MPDLNCGDACYLPAFLGSGYDLAQGNPDDDTAFDPGFRGTIFKLTFENGLKSEDGRYNVPDQSTSRLTSTCSFRSTSRRFQGT